MKLEKLLCTIEKVALWLLALSVLYVLAHAAATAERGYEAVGGEVFVWLIPLFYWLIKSSIREGKENKTKGKAENESVIIRNSPRTREGNINPAQAPRSTKDNGKKY